MTSKEKKEPWVDSYAWSKLPLNYEYKRQIIIEYLKNSNSEITDKEIQKNLKSLEFEVEEKDNKNIVLM